MFSFFYSREMSLCSLVFEYDNVSLHQGTTFGAELLVCADVSQSSSSVLMAAE